MPLTNSLAEPPHVDVESRYTLLEKVGSGTFATVYRARDEELGREVAIKQIHAEYMADPAALDRFWAEAQLLASLQHPNIVTIYDLHKDRGWIVMELMQTNLADRMQGKPLSVQAAKSTVAHCLRALKYLHERGITHGDVKPSNMMIDHRKRVKIGDFGLARRVSDEEGSLLKGTTRYMAPEVVSDEFGEIGPPSDLYSLGFSVYSLLCGENFEQLFPGLSAFGRNKQIAWMMWHAAPDRRIPEVGRVLQGVPEDLAQVVDKLVRKKQSERYTSAGAALDDLQVDQKIVKQVEGNAEKEEDPEEAARKKRLLVLGGFMALSVILSLAILLMPSGNEGPPPSAPSVVVFQGILESGEATKIKVTYVDEPGAKEMPLPDDPVITLHEFGQPSRSVVLRELEPGDRLELDRSDDTLRIVASRPIETVGRVTALRPGDKEIDVTPIRGRFRDDIELRLTDNTAITRNGKPVGLADLTEGDAVHVWHLPELEGKPGRVASRIDITEEREEVGFLESFDEKERTIAVRMADRDTPLVLTLAADVRVDLKEGKETKVVTPADLQRNDRLRITYDRKVNSIEATRYDGNLEGVVAAVDARLGTVTVRDAAGRATTFLVSPETDVVIGSSSASLADLRDNDQAFVTYDKADTGRTPTPSSITATREGQGNRWAIVVANSAYEADLPQLPYAVADAQRLRRTLIDRYRVFEERAVPIVDAAGGDLQRRFEEALAKVGPGSELVVYMGGHLLIGSDDEPYLAGIDVDPRRPEQQGVALAKLVAAMEASGAGEKILILDTCHEGIGASREPATADVVERLDVRPSVAVVASCGEEQRGHVGVTSTGDKGGLFANAVADGYGGPADADRNLEITPRELADHVRKQLRDADQTPVLLPPIP